MFAAGIGGGFTGRPVDLLIIDDPIKDREQADSHIYRENVWDWWTDVGAARLAPGAPVMLILTRWHHDDLAGRLLAADDGATGGSSTSPPRPTTTPPRARPTPSAARPASSWTSARGRTRPQWERRKRMAGSRTWAALYQGRPAPDAGNLFKRDWWPRTTSPVGRPRRRVPRVPGADPATSRSSSPGT